ALWLQQTPALTITPLIQRYFGALLAQQADFTVVPKLVCPQADPPGIRLSPVNPGVNGVIGESVVETWLAGPDYRIAFGDLGGRLLRILIAAPDGPSFQSFDPLVEGVLATIAVTP
ncbi:MAG TPA: hypothetical protein VEI48_10420, partial [Candidatus Sulfotelmatobacter sp.]|nr:hypothetical protein [Candidatus Sulfotelmatobacter sp.]